MAGPSLNPAGMFSEEQTSNEERGLGEWRWMNLLYECGYECMKKTAATQTFINSCTQSFLQCAFFSSEKAHVRI
jgi:hypothetical protein